MNNVYNIFSGKLLNVSDLSKIVEIESNKKTGYELIKERLITRFGDDLPKHFEKCMSAPQKQPYMHGDVHNVKYRKSTPHFNSPMPVPCEVTQESCKKIKGILTLGSRCVDGIDEPFPWMDRKYQVTLNFLKSLPDGTRIDICTRSDLIACDEYIDELKRLNCQVTILYSTPIENLNGKLSPAHQAI